MEKNTPCNKPTHIYDVKEFIRDFEVMYREIKPRVIVDALFTVNIYKEDDTAYNELVNNGYLAGGKKPYSILVLSHLNTLCGVYRLKTEDVEILKCEKTVRCITVALRVFLNEVSDYAGYMNLFMQFLDFYKKRHQASPETMVEAEEVGMALAKDIIEELPWLIQTFRYDPTNLSGDKLR